MFRRGVSICVMLGYLAGQSATVPHAHLNGSHHDHDACEPHIHLSWLGGSHHHCEHHDGDSFAVVTDQIQLALDTLIVRGTAEDHDDDAVYVPGGLTAGATTDEHPIGSPEWQPTIAMHSFGAMVDLSVNVRSFAAHLRPPDLIGHDCARFLKLSKLRI
jgi:hypothetical protein